MTKVDKDRPSTWKKYEAHLCQTCRANCCRMPVEVKASDLIRLEVITEDEIEQSIKKAAKKLKKNGVISSYRDGTDLFMISQQSNEDCYFLNSKTRQCTVYDKRPETCRLFPTHVGIKLNTCPYEKVQK